MEVNELKQAINKYGINVVADLTTQLVKNNSVASGKLVNSIEFKLNEAVADAVLSLEINAADYWKYVESGRKAGKMPNLEAVLTWVKLKGLPSSAAYPIAKKIEKYGIKAKPFLKDIIKAQSPTIQNFKKTIEESFQKDIEKELVKITTQLNKK